MSAPNEEALEASLDELLLNLDLDRLDADLFLGDPGEGVGRLFGGMVAAQCVIAAGRTVPEGRRMHSLHAYFLRPGRHDIPIRFVVDPIRDGKSFTTRRVKAHQAGEAIFSLSASFCRVEEGIAHQDPMPQVPPPEALEDWEQVRGKLAGAPPPPLRPSPIEVRMVDPWTDTPSPPVQKSWIRVRGELPEDPLVHTAMLVYASDRTLLSTAVRPHAISWKDRMSVSLDHTVWFHREVRMDGWLLYASESPVAHAAHGLIFGGLFYPDGRRVASVAQEGLVRRKRAR